MISSSEAAMAALRDTCNETTALLGQASGQNDTTQEHGQSNTRGRENDAMQNRAQDEENRRHTGIKNSLGSDPRYRYVSATQFMPIFGAILFGNTIAFFDSTFMTTAHPVITSYFKSSNSASWLSVAFLITSTSFQPLYGRLSDIFGRRPVYVSSIFIFLGATAWCASAENIGSLIAARAICGVGAGGILALATILTNDLVVLEYRGIYQAYLNLAYGLGTSSGVVFGGFLCDRLGWRAALGIQVPFIFIHLLVALWTTPHISGIESSGGQKLSFRLLLGSFDSLGSLLLIGSVTSLIMALNLAGNIFPWRHPIVIASLVSFVILTLLLIQVELRVKMPIMPISLLWSKPRGTIIFSAFFASAMQQTLLFNTPLFFQAVKLESPTNAGFRMVVSSISATVTNSISGFLITRTGQLGAMLSVGSVVFVIGATTTASLSGWMPTWLAMAFLVPSGLGQGLCYPATTILLLSLSNRNDQAVTTTTLSLWRNLGSVMGVSFSSWILQNSLLVYLGQIITGPKKNEIILLVRESVEAIKQLDPRHREQAIDAYQKALRLTLSSAIVWAIVVGLLIIPLRGLKLSKG